MEAILDFKKFRTCLVGEFLFLFSKQYENNFQKIDKFQI